MTPGSILKKVELSLAAPVIIEVDAHDLPRPRVRERLAHPMVWASRGMATRDEESTSPHPSGAVRTPEVS